MPEARDLFITGLKNAHAMEAQAHEMLERQIERLTDYPELRSKLREHLGETKEQMNRLQKCLSDLQSSPSGFKDATLSLGANVAAIGHAMAADEVLKNTFANCALEAYEIAAYKSLLLMAEQSGHEMKGILQESLREEERMADWVENHVEDITRKFMSKQARAA
jgi:ferritin-like metal-binding protein YciE